jgi:hypothetical protein
MSHDPAAIGVLSACFRYSPDDAAMVLRNLTAAGLAVVKVGEVPPWMKQPSDGIYGGLWVVERTPGMVSTAMSADGSDIPERLNPCRAYIIDPEWTP